MLISSILTYFILLKMLKLDLHHFKVCHRADFICWRGTLTRIACSPYEFRDGWRIAVVRYKSVIFICEFPTNEKILQLKSMSDRDKLMTYWGFKFEQYMTSDSLSVIFSHEFLKVFQVCFKKFQELNRILKCYNLEFSRTNQTEMNR